MGLGGLENAMKVKYFEYDYSKDGGAVGDITLRGGKIPKDAIALYSSVWVETAVASGGSATVALKLQSAADVMAATAKTSLTANAILDGIQDFTAANAIRCTADRSVTATVATAALTAGKFTVAVGYIMPKTS